MSDEPRSPTELAAVRRSLLQEIRKILLATPETLDDSSVSARRHRVIRAKTSITVGIATAKLHESGFDQNDRLYRIRDELAEGRAISRGEIVWLDRAIANDESKSG